MKLVRLNGELHIRADEKFVKITKANLVEVLRKERALPKGHEFMTKAQLLSSCSFDDSGNLVA